MRLVKGRSASVVSLCRGVGLYSDAIMNMVFSKTQLYIIILFCLLQELNVAHRTRLYLLFHENYHFVKIEECSPLCFTF